MQTANQTLWNSALVAALVAAVVSILANIFLYWKRRKDEAADYQKRRNDEKADYENRRNDEKEDYEKRRNDEKADYEQQKADRERQTKESVFQSLMATRPTFLSPEHVRALNMIEIAFYGGAEKEKRVREAWKALHHHLGNRGYGDAWEKRRVELMIELLYNMAGSLGYDFDRTDIETNWYSPQLHATIENELTVIRSTVAGILSGKIQPKPIPITIVDQESQPAASPPPT